MIGNIPFGVIPLIEKIAETKRAPVFKAENYWRALPRPERISHDKWFDLKGPCQKYNVKTIVTAFHLLLKYDHIQCPNLNLLSVRNAMRKTRKIMSFRGRWDVIYNKPFTIFDVCSNVTALRESIVHIRRLKDRKRYDKLYVIIGFSELTKFELGMLKKVLPTEAYYIIPCSDATLNAGETLTMLDVNGEIALSICEAIDKCLSMASIHDMVFIGGSHYFAPEILSRFQSNS